MLFRTIYLAHPHWWFSASNDEDSYIAKHFAHLLDHHESNDPLNTILIYDQLPYHVYRNTPSNHIIAWFLQKALAVCLDLDKAYLDTLTAEEWCFAFLPYRHTCDPRYITNVARLAWEKLAICSTDHDKNVLSRFLRATYDRCPTGDQSWCLQYYVPWMQYIPPHLHDIVSQYRHILADQAEGLQTIAQPIYININIPKAPLILSLSGGVDSMVCSYLLSQQKIPYQAVHINYGNRSTANAEEAFVRDWCSYLDVPLVVRRITEIQRDPCMMHNLRDVYESYTRRVRFGAYATVDPHALVILGHNKDDCFENIMTNIANQSHYDNLIGMYVHHENILRPLLHVPKAVIQAFAIYHHIPHLPNSTPPWSQRGQIRSQIIPVLNAWDPQFVPGLHQINTTLSEYHDISQHVARLFIAQRSIHFVINNACFWRSVVALLTPFHHPSVKSLNNLIKTVNDKPAPYTVVVSKHLTIKVDKHGNITFLRALCRPAP